MLDQKKALAVTGGAIGVVTLLATFTNALDTLNAKLPAIRALAPWFSGAALVYCATALLIYVYREWRNEKRERARKRREEIGHICNGARLLYYEAEQCYGPPGKRNHEHTPRDFQGAIDGLIRTLVQAEIYEQRVPFYEILRHLKNRMQIHPADASWKLIEDQLSFLPDWLEYAKREVSTGEHRHPRDPLAPKRS